MQISNFLRLINSAKTAPESSSEHVFFRASQSTLSSSRTIESMSALKKLSPKKVLSSIGLGLCPFGVLLLASNASSTQKML